MIQFGSSMGGGGKKPVPEKIWSQTERLDYIRRPNTSGPKPGAYSYSNTNFTLLGFMVEGVTQHTAGSEIRRRILEPLSMNHTYLEGFKEARSRVSPRRYHWNTAQFRTTAGTCPRFTQPRDNLIDATGSNLSVEWTAGAMVSTPSGLVVFAMALLNSKLLRPASLGVMKYWRPVGDSLEVGHGLFRFTGPKDAGQWLGNFRSVLGFSGAWFWKEETCAVCVSAIVGTVHAGRVPSSAPALVATSAFLELADSLAACET